MILFVRVESTSKETDDITHVFECAKLQRH